MDLGESTFLKLRKGGYWLDFTDAILTFQLAPEARLFLSEDVSLRQLHPLHFYYLTNIKIQEN